LVPHQANRRIIEAVAKRLGLDLDRVIINLDRYGNTVAATIPIALSESNERGRFAHGDRVVLSAFGAGFTAGSIFLRWGPSRTVDVRPAASRLPLRAGSIDPRCCVCDTTVGSG